MTVEELINELDALRREGYADAKVIVNLGKSELANSEELTKITIETVGQYFNEDYSCSEFVECLDVLLPPDDMVNVQTVVNLTT